MGSTRNGATPNGIATKPGDRVELSQYARLVARLRDRPDIREERVEHARAAINDPEYVNDEERLNTAIEGLLDDLALEDELGL